MALGNVFRKPLSGWRYIWSSTTCCGPIEATKPFEMAFSRFVQFVWCWPDRWVRGIICFANLNRVCIHRVSWWIHTRCGEFFAPNVFISRTCNCGKVGCCWQGAWLMKWIERDVLSAIVVSIRLESIGHDQCSPPNCCQLRCTHSVRLEMNLFHNYLDWRYVFIFKRLIDLQRYLYYVKPVLELVNMSKIEISSSSKVDWGDLLRWIIQWRSPYPRFYEMNRKDMVWWYGLFALVIVRIAHHM